MNKRQRDDLEREIMAEVKPVIFTLAVIFAICIIIVAIVQPKPGRITQEEEVNSRINHLVELNRNVQMGR